MLSHVIKLLESFEILFKTIFGKKIEFLKNAFLNLNISAWIYNSSVFSIFLRGQPTNTSSCLSVLLFCWL